MWEGIYMCQWKFTQPLFKQMSEGNFAEKQTCWFVVCSGTEALSAPTLSLPPFGCWLDRRATCLLSDWCLLSAAMGAYGTWRCLWSTKGHVGLGCMLCRPVARAVCSWDFCSLTKLFLAKKEDSSLFVWNVEKLNFNWHITQSRARVSVRTFLMFAARSVSWMC